MIENTSLKLEDYNAIPPLPEGELKGLIASAQKGNPWAKEKAVASNLHLVLWGVYLTCRHPNDEEDLFNEGVIALMRSIDRFDFSHDVKFASYAQPVINGTLKKCYRDRQLLAGLRRPKELLNKFNGIKRQMEGELRREVSLKEACQAMSLDEKEVELAINATTIPVSLYTPFDDDDNKESFLIDTVGDIDDRYNKIEDRIVLNNIIKGLSEEEKLFLYRRYFLKLTQKKIVEVTGEGSQMKVSRFQKTLLSKMRTRFK